MKKLVSLVLALVILIGCLPMSAFAADTGKTGKSLGEIAVVTLNTDGNGGYVVGSGAYSVGSTAVVTAELYPNGEFYGWYQNGELVSGDFVYDFTVQDDTTLTAKFKNISFYNFNITSTLGGVAEAATGQYAEGMEVELTAIPDEGYVFAGWITTAGEIDKVNSETTVFTMPGEPVTVTAKFVPLDMILGEWSTKNGKQIYLYQDGSYAVGWTYIDWTVDGKPGEWFYFDNDGYMMTGWIYDNYHYYINPTNGIMQRGWIKVNGEDYYMDSTGVMYVGWLEENGKKYYFNPYNGIMQRGWITVDGKKYFMNSDGEMVLGWNEIDGNWYYFDGTDGDLQYGWFATNGEIFYLNEDGSRAKGWRCIDEKWYYFDPDKGAMQKGWITLNGKKYYLDENGVMQSGWHELDGNKYYFREDGSMQTSWLLFEKNWYYFDANGIMQTGWTVVAGEDYYMNSDGKMLVGWLEQEGKKYYLNPTNGIMQRGVIRVDSKLYFMDKNGVLQTGWIESDGKKYYTNLDGALVTDWFSLNGDWYYFNPDNGVMQTGWVSIEGLWHEFSAEGIYLQVAEPIGIDFTAKITTNADLTKAVSLSGNNVELRTDDGKEDQLWRFILQDDGSYKIVNLSNEKCMDVADGKVANGTNIQVYNDNGLSPQRWVITRDGENEGYTFRPVCSINYYTVMDVINAETADGTNIVLSKSHFGSNQQFTITKIEEAEPSLPEPKYCLVGNIDGKDTGIEADWESIVNVMDANNQITLTFTEESYVFLKDVNNENWYMTLGWQGQTDTVTLYNTTTTLTPTGMRFDKMWVPAGTYTFTAAEKADGSIILSYAENIEKQDTLYLVTGAAWVADDARFAAYYFNAEGGSQWVDMTDENGDGIYEAQIPEGEWTNVIFCRMDPAATENNWDNKWNQTNDLTLDGVNNCFAIERPWSTVDTGFWSIYIPTDTPDTDNTTPTDPSQGGTQDPSGTVKPPVERDYCLIGHIDGVDVGDGDNWDDIVNVFDENNQFTLTVEKEAYVCLKDTNCSAWFMTLGWVGDVSSAVLYNTSTTTIPGDMQFDKLHVPAGTYKFTVTENLDGTVKLSYEKVINDQVSDIIGDIDNSGKLSVEDVTYIQKTLVGIYDVAEETKLVGDVNGNGKLDIRDATLIQLYLAKKIEHFPVENVG